MTESKIKIPAARPPVQVALDAIWYDVWRRLCGTDRALRESAVRALRESAVSANQREPMERDILFCYALLLGVTGLAYVHDVIASVLGGAVRIDARLLAALVAAQRTQAGGTVTHSADVEGPPAAEQEGKPAATQEGKPTSP